MPANVDPDQLRHGAVLTPLASVVAASIPCRSTAVTAALFASWTTIRAYLFWSTAAEMDWQVENGLIVFTLASAVLVVVYVFAFICWKGSGRDRA